LLSACGGTTTPDDAQATLIDAGAIADASVDQATHVDGAMSPPVDGAAAIPDMTSMTSSLASAGCNVDAPAEGVLALQAKDGTGASRDYQLYTPNVYDKSKRYALVFMYSNDPVGIENIPGSRDAAFFIRPTQSQTQWGMGWDDTCGGKDVGYFDDMLAYVADHYCLDLHRVFASGFSWGADHATALACCRADKLRAIASHASDDEYATASDFTTYWNWGQCSHPAVPPAVRFTHQVLEDGAYPAPLFDTTSKLYRALDGCAATSQPTTPSPCVKYDGCTAPVVECEYTGIGHDFYPDWAKDSWAFFASFP
jgi:poly(3-hydroxybutyrate) depolymerase